MLRLTVTWAGGSDTHSSINVQGPREEREELIPVAIETLVEALRDIHRADGGHRW